MEPEISIITWRIGKTPVEDLERLMLNEENRGQILLQLKEEFHSIFYLSTCQRIIIASSETSEDTLKRLENRFIELATDNTTEISSAEFWKGTVALHHLAKTISSLDSIVLGEDQSAVAPVLLE